MLTQKNKALITQNAENLLIWCHLNAARVTFQAPNGVVLKLAGLRTIRAYSLDEAVAAAKRILGHQADLAREKLIAAEFLTRRGTVPWLVTYYQKDTGIKVGPVWSLDSKHKPTRWAKHHLRDAGAPGTVTYRITIDPGPDVAAQ